MKVSSILLALLFALLTNAQTGDDSASCDETVTVSQCEYDDLVSSVAALQAEVLGLWSEVGNTEIQVNDVENNLNGMGSCISSVFDGSSTVITTTEEPTTTTTEAAVVVDDSTFYSFHFQGSKCQWGGDDRVFKVAYNDDLENCANTCLDDPDCAWFSQDWNWCIGCKTEPTDTSTASASYATYFINDRVQLRRQLNTEIDQLRAENNALKAALRRRL